MALYESTFIIRSDVTSQDVDKIADNFSAIATDNGGKVVKKEYWGLRSLAYKINKGKRGHYLFLGLDANGDAIAEITRKANINEDVIRNVNIKVDAISKDPSPVMKAANE